VSSNFRAEQLDSGMDTGFAGQGQQLYYQQQLFAAGNGEFFAAKQTGKESNADLHAVHFVDTADEEKSGSDFADKKSDTKTAATQQASVEPLQPIVSWRIDIEDTPAGGKHMGIRGLGEGDLHKQPDGSFQGELVDKDGQKTAVKINPDGTVNVQVDGDDLQFKLKPDGTVDSVTNLFGGIYQRTERSDGTGEMKFKDGSSGYTFRTNPDGSEDRQYTDGSTEHASEGGSFRKYPNGSTREQMADGTTVYTDAVTGVVVRSTPDHIVTINYKDGTKITRLPDNTTITRDPDGTTRTQKLDGSSTQLPDGTVVRTTIRQQGGLQVDVLPPGQKPAVPHRPTSPQRSRETQKPAGASRQDPGPDNQGQVPPVGDAADLNRNEKPRVEKRQGP